MQIPALEPRRFDLQVDLRLCRREDVRGLEWDGAFEAHRQVFEEAFEAQERGEAAIVLAVLAGRPVAQVFVDLTREEVGYLWAFRVRPPLLGLGLGSWVLEASEDLLIRAGFSIAEMTVEKDNPRALRLYRRRGYEIVGERIDHWSTVTPQGQRLDHELDTWVVQKTLG